MERVSRFPNLDTNTDFKMKTLRIESRSEQDTARLGQLLAKHLPDGTVVALDGTLGAGKTRLVQAIAASCGVPIDKALSPTFMLWHTYHGDRTIHHLDAYRIRDEDEFCELGVEECFNSSAITLIEWAERIIDCLPDDRLEIRIEVVGEEERSFELSATGEPIETALGQLAAEVA